MLFWMSIVMLAGIFIGGTVLIVQARIPEGGVDFPAMPGIQTDKLKEILNSYE